MGNRCKFYNKFSANVHCDAGVRYETFASDSRALFRNLPCIGAVPPTRCAKFTEDEEWAREGRRLREINDKLIGLENEIRARDKGKNTSGTGPCPICGKPLRWWHASNGHLSMQCETPNCVCFMQ